MGSGTQQRQQVEKDAQIRVLFEQGHSASKIAKIYGYSYTHVKRVIARITEKDTTK